MDTDSEDSTKKPFTCTYEGCKSSFTKNRKLQNHLRRHAGERPFACDKPGCTKTYTNSSHLLRHKKVSHEKQEANFVCTVQGCDRAYHSSYALKKHASRAHVGGMLYPYNCAECNQGFDKKHQLQKHIYLHTGKTYECDVCGKKFFREYERTKHKKKHVDYKCKCGDEFRRWHDFVWHKNTYHKSSEYKCKVCSQTFANKMNLKHHGLTHLSQDERDVFVCPREECDRYYFHKKNLQTHVKVYHEKQKKEKIPCPFENCKATLSKMQNLKKHLDVHKHGVQRKEIRARRKDAGKKKKTVAADLAHVKWTAAVEFNKSSDKSKDLVDQNHEHTEEVRKNNDLLKSKVSIEPTGEGVGSLVNKESDQQITEHREEDNTLVIEENDEEDELIINEKINEQRTEHLEEVESIKVAFNFKCSVILEDCTKSPVHLSDTKLLQVQVTYNNDLQPMFQIIEYEKDMDLRFGNVL